VQPVASGFQAPPIPLEHAASRLDEDSQLIAQVLAGRKDLFSNLLAPHLGALCRLIRTRLRNDGESDDVIQQTLLKALVHLGQFRFKSSFRTWLMSIALNEVFQWRRKRLSWQFLILKHSSGTRPQRFSDETASPHMQCERREAAALLRKALVRLPEKYQIMIQLRDLEDLSIAEVSQLLNMSVAAIKGRHRRARQELVSLMREKTEKRAS
jgi:RNA polymerase sigma-70 factor (ECF subfamily)